MHSTSGKSSGNWFQGNDRVHVIKLSELLDALDQGWIGLPSFQRGQAWDAGRITFLWDSLLRGYPMGSLMLIPAQGVDPVLQRSLTNAERGRSKWLLLDGQQRCRSISLAGCGSWNNDPKENAARLWIDLADFITEIPGTDAPSPFHLTTLADPWGISVHQGKVHRTTEAVKKKARELLHTWLNGTESNAGEEPGDLWRAPSEKRSEGDPQWKYRWRYPDPWLNLQYTWPERAQLPVPVAELVSNCRSGGSTLKRDISVDDVSALLPKREGRALWNEIVHSRGGFEGIHDAVRHVQTSIEKLLNYEVVLIRVPTSELANERDVPLLLNDIFQRINRQGASLTEAELFFSTVKIYHPQAHDAVDEIHKDPETGRILEPLEIVHAGARLARSRPDKNASSADDLHDLPRLTLGSYKNLVEKPEQEVGNPFLRTLVNYFSHSEPELADDEAGLHETLSHVRKALSFNNIDYHQHDIGLPLPLLATLSWRVWHVLVGWAIHRPLTEILDNRKKLIQFALVYHFFNNSTAQGGIRKTFLTARWNGWTRERDEFPVETLLGWLYDNQYLYAYAAIRDEEKNYPKGILRPAEYERYAKHDNWWILQNERDLLFWSQRSAVHQWFDQLYDPLHHTRSDEKPFDIDHIVPNDWFSYVTNKCDEFSKCSSVKDSIGNKRVWPQPLNRSEGNRLLRERGLVGGQSFSPEGTEYRFWGLNRPEQIARDSNLCEDELACLAEVDSESYANRKDWSHKERCEAFERFARKRMIRLYREFYDALEFEKLGRVLYHPDLD